MRVAACALLVLGAAGALRAQTPLTGHYPPGQSGIRGAATPASGLAYTNFSRFFSNLELVDAGGEPIEDVNEVRFANISMITWTTKSRVLGMTYGMLAGIPFATGNLRPAADETDSSGFGLGDVLLTPVSLYGKSTAFDYQLQLTVWSASGRFGPGSLDNRGTGFWALVYSLGGVYYPRGKRDLWSLSAVARIEQNFEQRHTGISPGDDVVLDWGVGRVLQVGKRALDLGVSGFGAWQITSQDPGGIDRYRFYGAGPEGSLSLSDSLSLRVRAQWEFGARNVVRGNNLWIILNKKW